MKTLLNTLFTLFFSVLFAAACTPSEVSVEEDTEITDAVYDDFGVDVPEDYYIISFMHLGISMGEVSKYVSDFLPQSIKQIENGASVYVWDDTNGVSHRLYAKHGQSETLEYITYRFAFTSEELQTISWNYQNTLFHLLEAYYGNPIMNEQEEFSGLAHWFTAEDVMITLEHEHSYIEIKMEYVVSP
jgi:hypothetical protein